MDRKTLNRYQPSPTFGDDGTTSDVKELLLQTEVDSVEAGGHGSLSSSATSVDVPLPCCL